MASFPLSLWISHLFSTEKSSTNQDCVRPKSHLRFASSVLSLHSLSSTDFVYFGQLLCLKIINMYVQFELTPALRALTVTFN